MTATQKETTMKTLKTLLTTESLIGIALVSYAIGLAVVAFVAM
jgi:hypothetical protein